MKNNVPAGTVVLGPLAKGNGIKLTQLDAETLHVDAEDCEPFTVTTRLSMNEGKK